MEMPEPPSRSRSWKEELASIVQETGIQYTGDGYGVPAPVDAKVMELLEEEEGEGEKESFKDQMKGFLKASAEMLQELAKGCGEVVKESFGKEDSYVVKKFGGHWKKVSGRLRFLNEFLPEDRDPVHAWPVVFFVFFIALSVLNVNREPQIPLPTPKKVYIHPPTATRVQLPDGRYMAYHERGVPADRARFSLISPHSFLSSRLAGIPGVKESLLEEFGIRLITYDLPGFGESDPHPHRSLNSSAMDMLDLADALYVKDKFWVVGYSGGGMHAWAALRYIPDRLSGAAMFAPIVNPYDSSMTKEERNKIWEKWTSIRKVMYMVARRFPSLLKYFYRRNFLSGQHGQIDKLLGVSLVKKDKALIEKLEFEEFWQRDVEESIRQGHSKPFMEEAVLHVSKWGFTLSEIQVQRKRQVKGFLPWLRSIYTQAEQELAGFLGPIHIWQDSLIIKVPKKSPLVLRMIVVVFAMVCGVYIFSICLQQSSTNAKLKTGNLQLVQRQCPPSHMNQSEKAYLHYPNPTTYSREECACNPVRYFAIFSMQRSGSGWFETLLNNHTNVSSNGEIFSVKERRSNISSIVHTLDKVYNLDWLSSASKNECTAAVGFKWMLNQGLMQHHEEIVEYFERRGVSAIFLFRRNLLRRVVSVLANNYDRDKKLLNGTHKSHVHSPKEAEMLAKYKPVLNATLLIPNLKKENDTMTKALKYFKSTRHILLYYEDLINNRTKLNLVQDFLRVPHQELKSRQVKIHKGSLAEQVENWDDIDKAFKGTEFENYLFADYKM